MPAYELYMGISEKELLFAEYFEPLGLCISMQSAGMRSVGNPEQRKRAAT